MLRTVWQATIGNLTLKQSLKLCATNLKSISRSSAIRYISELMTKFSVILVQTTVKTLHRQSCIQEKLLPTCQKHYTSMLGP